LNRARQKIVENELRDFRLGGAELAAPEKARFMEIQEELARLSAKFEENLLDATNAFSVLIVDRGELSGIPDDVMEAAASAAREEQKNGKNGVRHQ
jgi:oligopeptidase A